MNAWPAWALRLGLGARRSEEIIEAAPSPKGREYLTTNRVIGGALLFHKWAASWLPPNVRAHYGDRFVLGAHHRLTGDVYTRTMFHEYAEQKLFNPKPAPTVSLACSECRCGMVGRKFADCLSRRFRKAYDRINSDSFESGWSLLLQTYRADVSAPDNVVPLRRPRIH